MAKEKILIIEDEKILADVLRAKLEKEGFVAEVAYDGEDGYQKIGQWHPDLVLLDIVMPKLNGYEVLEKLYEEKSSIPVIIISNSGQPVELEKTKKLGAVDHLVKADFSPREVIQKIKNYLNREQTLDEMTKEGEKTKEGASIPQDEKKIKVLLVEDDKFLRSICSTKLIKEGFMVIEATDGEKALETIEKSKPSIVLLDVVLPVLDGFQVLEKIRALPDPELAKTPVIILSNLGQDEDVRKAKELGADHFLIKANFTTQEIVENVKTILKKRLREEMQANAAAAEE